MIRLALIVVGLFLMLGLFVPSKSIEMQRIYNVRQNQATGTKALSESYWRIFWETDHSGLAITLGMGVLGTVCVVVALAPLIRKGTRKVQ